MGDFGTRRENVELPKSPLSGNLCCQVCLIININIIFCTLTFKQSQKPRIQMIFLTLSDVNMGDFGTLWANVELPKSPLQVHIFQKKWDIVVCFCLYLFFLISKATQMIFWHLKSFTAGISVPDRACENMHYGFIRGIPIIMYIF
jgi:hypothetical protein